MRVLALRQAALFCVLSFLIGGIGTASAQTMSYADAISQLAAACGRDVARYCNGVPLSGALKNCLDGHASVLSPGCAQTRAAVYSSIGRRAAAQSHIGDICGAGYRAAVRHLACRCASRRMPADDVAGRDQSGLQPGLHRYRLAHGEGTAMKPHYISAVAAVAFALVVTAAFAQNRIGSGQMTNSLAAVSGDVRLDLTASQMRQAALGQYPQLSGGHSAPPAVLSAATKPGAVHRRSRFRFQLGGDQAVVLPHRRRHRRRAAQPDPARLRLPGHRPHRFRRRPRIQYRAQPAPRRSDRRRPGRSVRRQSGRPAAGRSWAKSNCATRGIRRRASIAAYS